MTHPAIREMHLSESKAELARAVARHQVVGSERPFTRTPPFRARAALALRAAVHAFRIGTPVDATSAPAGLPCRIGNRDGVLGWIETEGGVRVLVCRVA